MQRDLNMKGMISRMILSALTDYMEINQEENNA